MKRIFTLVATFAALFTLTYCSSSKKASSKKQEVAKVTFEGNVLPLIQAKCSPCHIPPEGKKKFYVNYDSAKADIDDMIRRISLTPADKGFMPFKKTERLPDSLIAVFVKWKADGLREK